MKWRSCKNENQERKLEDCLESVIISSPKHKIPTRAYSPFTFVLSENVFRQGMVVLLILVCVLLSGMLDVSKSDLIVAVFET